jgi:hypothetical protein
VEFGTAVAVGAASGGADEFALADNDDGGVEGRTGAGVGET